ncbi:hypothetical protein V494_02904 [Pseudogymnoascus sp. VKM F-4513 (FW-928)]|nr:hypothetical protein V494_02904 [Pseudogymnoascus sp. VKM F-4513 (FW-928)]
MRAISPPNPRNLTSPRTFSSANSPAMPAKLSPFLCPGDATKADELAIVYLRRDHQVPTILRERDDDDEGYSEGKVINTRFGSFPHSTLTSLPWGSQVRASKVDTGSRGRRQKRKRDDGADDDEPARAEPTQAVTAASGFVHLLPPTPENWTSALPHRTQVVYTPDYAYILHRIRARPGSRIIEAGAGSGSFTHASARAVYSGYPSADAPKRNLGRVFSYEFHAQRHEKLVLELADHGLEGVVEIAHRDVCGNGFLVGEGMDKSPGADAVFLDLPAPWLALPHLSRRAQPPSILLPAGETPRPFVSSLNPHAPVHICTFSPCIEQVQRTISCMRQLGWVQIQMVEVQQRRVEVRRERVGIVHGQAVHGMQNTAASVDEALVRLREIEGRFRSFHGSEPGDKAAGSGNENGKAKKVQPNSREAIVASLIERKAFKEGNLIHKTEQEVKTHTSYLVFAVLPVEWSEEDEERAAAQWPAKAAEVKGKEESGKKGPVSNRQMKRDAKAAEKARLASLAAENGEGEGTTNGNTGGDNTTE